MNMDLISIVVAVYNAENTLERCIDSLLIQTYKNTEIILVNDCSSDNSLSICKNYELNNDNIIVISNEKNMGVSVTRNNGIEKSTGRYICFVDSDDYVEPNYLEVLYNYFKEYNAVPICGFTYYNEVEKSQPIPYKWSGGDGLVSLGRIFELNDELCVASLWNKLFDNEIVKKNNVRFKEGLSMGEDLKFSLEYFLKNGCEYVYITTQQLYNYIRNSPDTLMQNFGLGGIDNERNNLMLMRTIAQKFSTDAQSKYENRLENLKNNCIYFISRAKGLSDTEKLKRIQNFKPEYSKKDLRKEKILILKEKVYKLIIKR